MRSKKNLVIGFLLLLLGIGLSEYSLPLSILAGMAGIVMIICNEAVMDEPTFKFCRIFSRHGEYLVFKMQKYVQGMIACHKIGLAKIASLRDLLQ